MNLLEVGDTVKVTLNGEDWESILVKKVGIFWKLSQTHPKDCCNFWLEENIKLIKKK